MSTIPDFSIIVPVYNCEELIEECLESILAQTFSNWEAIVVDDGSSDNSLEIIQAYARRDPRVKVLHQQNSGVSTARNNALNILSGKYTLFLDSDDWLDIKALELLSERISKNPEIDLLLFNYHTVGPFNEVRSPLLDDCYSIVGREVFTKDKLGSKLLYLFGGVAGKLIRSEIIRDHKIRFEPRLKNSEDYVFYLKLLEVSKKLQIFNHGLYYYRAQANKNTLTTSSTAIEDIANSCEYALSQFKDVFSPVDILGRFLKTMRFVYTQPSYRKNLKALNIIRLYVEKAKSYGAAANYFIKPYEKFISDQYLLKNRIKTFFSFQHTPGLIQFKLGKFNIKIKGFRTYLNQKKLINSKKQVLERVKERFAQKKKIRVIFLFNELPKIKTLDLLSLFNKSPYFELQVVLIPSIVSSFEKQKADLLKTENYFKSLGISVFCAYNKKNGSITGISSLQGELFFYQQPWDIPKGFAVTSLIDKFLLCYVPYYVANYGNLKLECSQFHKHLFRYYTLNDDYNRAYAPWLKPMEDNLVPVGHPAIDELLRDLAQSKANDNTVVYAPHFSIGRWSVGYGTFVWSGFFMLQYAKNNPQYRWVFKPHPRFARELVVRRILTPEQVEDYFNEWKKIGRVVDSYDYFNIFSESCCLITDCGSFLTEYSFTGKPLIHLVSGLAHQPLFPLRQILRNYYQVCNLKELEETLDSLLGMSMDPKKEQREKFAKQQREKYKISASQNIYQDLLRVLSMSDQDIGR